MTRTEKREFLKEAKAFLRANREERRADKEREKQQREQARAERRAADEQVSERWRRQREERGFPYLNVDEVAPMVKAGTFGTMGEFAAHYKLSPGMARWLQRIVLRRSGMKDAEWKACFAEARKQRRKVSAPRAEAARP